MSKRIVLCGWGQVTQRLDAAPPFGDPVDLMAAAAREAGLLAGRSVWPLVDTVLVVRPLSRSLQAPSEALVHRLGIKPTQIRVSGIGGETPQHLVNQAAGLLARGEARAVLIAGAETYYPRTAADMRGEGALVQGIPDDYDAEDMIGSDEHEQRHGLTLPIHGFPLFETALWAKSGLGLADWLKRVGTRWSRFSAVAAAHPNAWTREPVSAERIVTPTADNREVCFPYTKRMTSLVMADLGAAVLMSTERVAAQVRDGGARPVYFLGGAFAKDRQRFMAEKADFTRGPAMAAAMRKALQRAGLGLPELEGFDLYSCFPSAVTLAMGELGLADDDPRPLTQTGGLGFFGGPGSNYALHGIASLAQNIASGKLGNGLATGLGWLIHKYSVGVYSATPGAPLDGGHDQEDLRAPETGAAPVARTLAASGPGCIETYTVIYDRERTPARSLLYGRLDDRSRFVANGSNDAEAYTRLTTQCAVGAKVRVAHDAARGLNFATFIDP